VELLIYKRQQRVVPAAGLTAVRVVLELSRRSEQFGS